MIAAETIAKVGKVQAEITTAATNKQAAEVAITQLLGEAGNADYNKILVDSAAQYKLVEAAEKEYHMALNSCVGTEVQKYLDEMMTAKKTEDKYDAMTADQKKAWDEKHAAMLDKKADHMADLRMAAEYHKMDDASKAMFDKMFIAQQKVMKENKSKMDDMINKDGMDKAKWDALSDEEKAKMKDKMKDMRDHVGDMMDKRGKADFEMMAKAKYFNMNKDQQKVFDEKMGERRG